MQRNTSERNSYLTAGELKQRWKTSLLPGGLDFVGNNPGPDKKIDDNSFYIIRFEDLKHEENPEDKDDLTKELTPKMKMT